MQRYNLAIARGKLNYGHAKLEAVSMGISQGKIRGISELALWVKDLDRAVEFYRALGFAVDDVDPGKNAFLRSGDLLLVLFVPESPGTALAEAYIRRTGGPQGDVYHVGFNVATEELDTYAAELGKRGIDVRGPIEFKTGRRSYFVEDPDRHYIELTDR
jgi:catechol 2,3-dioxygenase-like lactoylglutathione lyase family enzyme